MRVILIPVVVAALVPFAPAQGGEIKIEPKWMPDEIVRPAEVDKKTAKAMVKEFSAAIKTTDVDAQLEAIGRLLSGRSPEMVKPLSALLTRAEHPVRRRAAKALAAIGSDKALPALQRAMRARKNRPESDIMDALGTAIGLCANPKKSLFRQLSKGFDGAEKETKRATVLALGHSKDRKALEMLAGWLEAPRPENPDAPNNPPASYWKERYAQWNFIKKQVKWAVWNITGELLDTEEEVTEWIEEQKKKKRE